MSSESQFAQYSIRFSRTARSCVNQYVLIPIQELYCLNTASPTRIMPEFADNAAHTNGADPLVPLCHIVTPVGCLGFGIDKDIIDAELERLIKTGIPTAIILDSGSTDSGPSKLATGSTSAPLFAYKRDLGHLIPLVHKYHVPLLFSSAGGDGSGKHVDDMVDVIEGIQETSDR
jgi:hypothetical protein